MSPLCEASILSTELHPTPALEVDGSENVSGTEGNQVRQNWQLGVECVRRWGTEGLTSKLWFSPKSWNEVSVFIVGGKCVLHGLPQSREVSLAPLPCFAAFLRQVFPSTVSIPIVGCTGRRGECLGRASQGPGVPHFHLIGDRRMSVTGSRLPKGQLGLSYFHLASDCALDNYFP